MTPAHRAVRPGDRDGPRLHHRRRSVATGLRYTTGRSARPTDRRERDRDLLHFVFMSIIDISRALSPSTAVWPGDRPFEWSWSATIGEGSPVNVGAFCSSTHAGSHADAPRHFREEGATIDEMDLSAFVGPAQVVEIPGESRIQPDQVPDLQAPRVLFKTLASQEPDSSWSDAFPVLAPETVAHLAEQSVVLVGVDTPSVDPPDSKELPTHHALSEAGIVNLENLRFDGVRPGLYRLTALPLKLIGADAAPVRAVLQSTLDA